MLLLAFAAANDCERLLKCIVSASQARSSLIWAGEAFDVLKSRPDILRQMSTRYSHNVFSERRRAQLNVRNILAYLKTLTVPKLEKDLRACLRSHPWRDDSFINFLTVHCADGEVDVHAMEEFYRLQGWLADYMADTSDTSVYNDTPNADFYRKLAVNQPHLVDWLLQAEPSQITQFRNIMTDLELYAEHWHELQQGREGLDIFNRKYEEAQQLPLNSIKRRRSTRTRRPALAHKVVHRDFHASILHWLTFEQDSSRSEHMHRLVEFLQVAGKQVNKAVSSRASRRHERNVEVIDRILSIKSREQRPTRNAKRKVVPVNVSPPN